MFIILVLASAASIVGAEALELTFDDAERMYQDSMLPVIQLERTRADLRFIRDVVASTSGSPDPAPAGGRLAATLRRNWTSYRSGNLSPGELAMAAKLDPAIEQMAVELEQSVPAERKNTDRGALVNATREAIGNLDRLVEVNAEEIRQQNAIFKSRHSATLLAMVAVLIAGVAALVVLARRLTRSIVGPSRTAVELASQIASGRLGHLLGSAPNDELGDMVRHLGQMDRQLASLVGRIHSGGVLIDHGAADIADAAALLSARSQTQAAAIEETGHALQGIGLSASENAQAALRAHRLSNSLGEGAQRGAQMASAALSAVRVVEGTCSEAFSAMSLIAELAALTNILSLNAAVEAARAGNAGAGFAVVARQIRELSNRSAEVSRTVSTLIERAKDDLAKGREKVEDTDDAFNEIGEQANVLVTVMGEISSACANQSSAVAEINSAVNDIDRIIQSNAELAQNLDEGSTELKRQTASVAEVAGYFVVDKKAGAEANQPLIPVLRVAA